MFSYSVSQPGPKSSKKRSRPKTGSTVRTDTGSPPAKKETPAKKAPAKKKASPTPEKVNIWC